MKKIFIVLFLLCGCAFAEAPPEEPWVSYRRIIAKEKVKVKFPTVAQEQEMEEMFFAHASGVNMMVEYMLTGLIKPDPTLDAQEKFDQILEAWDSDHFTIEFSEFLEINGNSVLDMSVIASAQKLHFKIRYLATKSNIFGMITAYPENAIEQHEKFINSFSIKKK